MRSLSFFLLYSIASCILHAQTSVKTVSKPPLSISDLGKWPSVSNPKISNDGKFAIYTYKEDDRQSLIIKSTNTGWEKQIAGASTYNTIITENSRFVITKINDSLIIVSLKDGQTEIVPGVLIFSTPAEGSGEWLAYQLNGAGRELVLRNIVTNKERRFSSVTAFVFNLDGKTLLLKTEPKKDSSQLQWLTTTSGNSFIIWRGARMDNFSMDVSGTHLAFIGEDPNDKAANAVWYYTPVMDSAIVIVNNKNEGIEQELSVASDAPRFNKDGSKVFFYLQPPPLPKPKSGYVSVDVWSYMDTKLQSQQLYEVNQIKHYLAVINVEKSNLSIQNQSKVIRIEHEGDEVNAQIEKLKADYVLVNRRLGDPNESAWNPASMLSVYLVSTKDSSGKLLRGNIPFWTGFYNISPDEKFIINYDIDQKNYFSYEIGKGISKKISLNIPFPLYSDEQGDNPDGYLNPYGMGTWATKDKFILIYDRYDIWQIDPLGIQRPICLTKGYGRSNKIIFRLLNEGNVIEDSIKDLALIVTAFNKGNKESGFYKIKLGKSSLPQLLFKGDYAPNNSYELSRAKSENVYLMKRENIVNANYFITKDFTNYIAISDIQPPKQSRNWFTNELIDWNTYDGIKSQGVLYKPDNFDSTKKYPTIFYFYEQMSDQKNIFHQPDLLHGGLDISFFVSNGYLVFTPDIHYKTGMVGESVYNSVVSAANFLKRFKWIDSARIGIIGHSFGGYEVNYLITHTNVFAAAVSASGLSDIISYYGSAMRFGYCLQWAEKGQGRFGFTLWENPNSYIYNSPIFNANVVTTPLLMMNNKKDGSVPFEQGVEFFTALRRLGKRVWMLQYDKENHDIDSKRDSYDYSIRVMQYFNHYLKNTAPAKWMTRGIKAYLKGLDNGLELDN